MCYNYLNVRLAEFELGLRNNGEKNGHCDDLFYLWYILQLEKIQEFSQDDLNIHIWKEGVILESIGDFFGGVHLLRK